MKMDVFYSEKYHVDIGRHVFPTEKYRLIREKIINCPGMADNVHFVEPQPASIEDVLRAHDVSYIDKLKNGTLSHEEVLTLELPYSKELFESALLCCGGTVGAAFSALLKKVGFHLGGGFHHAFPDHGEGFCVLNDIAVAVKKLIGERKIRKALIVDCDLHQGNGTAFMFQKEKNVFTFSIHQENNYPFYKPKSDMDIGLPDRTKDAGYLKRLEENVPKVISEVKPQLIIYVAGADPYENDQIGNLSLTIEGLRKRDLFIYNQAKNYDIPIATVLAGGYAINRNDTAEIHFNTLVSALEVFYNLDIKNIKNQISNIKNIRS